MSLKIIYGKSGSGKSEYCYQEIAKNIQEQENVLLITPEQFSFTAEKKLMDKLEKKAVLNAEVLHLSRMAKRVINELGIKDNHMTKCGKAMLISNILTNSKKELAYLSKSEESIEIAINAISELKKHGVTIEKLKEQIEKTENPYLRTKLKDISIIYEQYDNKIKENYIDEADELAILSQNLEKIEWIKNSIIYIDEFAGFTYPEYQVIKELIKYAKQVNITITTDELTSYTNPDTDIFYMNKITVQKLLDLCKLNNLKIEEPIYMNEIKRFKTEELKHIEDQLFKTKSTKYEQKVQNISLFLAKNQYTELEYIARKIRQEVKEKQIKYNDIAIITKNIEKYANLAKVIFRQYEIPIFIDEKRELSQNIIIQYILSVFEVLQKNYSKESVFQYIKMGLIDIDVEDISKLENYCTKWGIDRYKFKRSFNKELETNKEEVTYLNNLRKQIIDPLENLKNKIQENKSAKAISKTIYEFIIEQKIEEKIIQKIEELQEIMPDLAKEYKESYEILINILDEITNIFQEDTLTIEQYKNLLKQGIKASGLGKIPGTQDQVIMGDVDRSRSHQVKTVFIIGLNDGVYPSVNKTEGFLGDEDRAYLKENGIELAKGTIENLYDDNFNIYKAFTTAEESIYLSYSSSETTGASLRPSIYISRIKKIFPELKELSDVITPIYELTSPKATYEELIQKLAIGVEEPEKLEEIWKEVYNYYKNQNEWKEQLNKDIQGMYYTNLPENIQEETIQKLYGNTLNTSVSRLETYKQCPFSYFLKYGLKLKEREELKIQSFDTGSFMHEVIDMFFEEVKDQKLELPIFIAEEEKLQEIVHKIIQSKLDYEKYRFTATVKSKILIKRLEKMVARALKYIIEGLVYSDFNVQGTETEFGKGKEYDPITLQLENGQRIEITGKIDRIDVAKTEDGNYLRIIDYKSSAHNIDLNEVYAGLQIQLLTYLDAICQVEDLLPAGILYFNLVDKMVSKKRAEEEIEEEMRKFFKMKGLVLADINVIQMQDKNLQVGEVSKYIPAGLASKGGLKNTSGVDSEEFKVLQDYISTIIKQIGKEILQGKIELKPYYYKKSTPCSYCGYHSICGFNCKNKNNKYNYIHDLPKDEVIKKMK